jgi:hypothetical protein
MDGKCHGEEMELLQVADFQELMMKSDANQEAAHSPNKTTNSKVDGS